uniref:Uncharacterized protein n=1 Tax=Glossina pallidipes TaxID=7398 RepID=A0A1A9ZNQ9_GLOPL
MHSKYIRSVCTKGLPIRVILLFIYSEINKQLRLRFLWFLLFELLDEVGFNTTKIVLINV